MHQTPFDPEHAEQAAETLGSATITAAQEVQRARAREFMLAWQEAFNALAPVRSSVTRETERLICEMHSDLTATVEAIRRLSREQGVERAAAAAVEHERVFSEQWDHMLRLWTLRLLTNHEQLVHQGIHQAIQHSLHAAEAAPAETPQSAPEDALAHDLR